MSGYNCHKSLHDLSESCLEACISLEERKRGVSAPKLHDALMIITSELHSWGLENAEAFRSLVFVPQLCAEILRARDGEEGCFGTTDDVYAAFYPEYQNLLKILSGRDDADLDQAKKFCLLLNRVGLAQWEPGRRGLAA